MDMLAMMDKAMEVVTEIRNKAKVEGNEEMKWTALLLEMHLTGIKVNDEYLDDEVYGELELALQRLMDKAVQEDVDRLYTEVLTHIQYVDAYVTEKHSDLF